MAETSFNNAFQLFNKGDTSADAWDVLRRDYWDAVGGNDLPHGVDLAAYALALVVGVDAVREALPEIADLPVLEAIDLLCARFPDSDVIRAEAREMSLDVTP